MCWNRCKEKQRHIFKGSGNICVSWLLIDAKIFYIYLFIFILIKRDRFGHDIAFKAEKRICHTWYCHEQYSLYLKQSCTSPWRINHLPSDIFSAPSKIKIKLNLKSKKATQNAEVRELRHSHQTSNSTFTSTAASHFQVAVLLRQVCFGCSVWLMRQLRVGSSVEEREYNVSGFCYQEVGRVIYISTLVL